MYFSLFPVLPYDANGDGRVSLVTNLMKRVRVRANVKKELALLQRYPIQDGESPEMVADKHFGHTHYHWIILLLNGITDPYHDWPKSQREMQLYLNNKYGTRLNDVHHYEISQTSGDTTIQIEVDNTSYPSATPITNYTYEHELNESKREIDLLDTSYTSFFVEEFTQLIAKN
tara:strand:+ start:191 stop:709 length:519 start_codon:yes stop_codon:yes gene_type:complete